MARLGLKLHSTTDMETRACFAALLLLAACRSAAPSMPAAPNAAEAPGAVDEARARKELQLKEAQAAFELDSADEDKLIWYARRLAYLDRFEEAQAVYTKGLESHPRSWKILRHRGHRWITLRNFERAREDLMIAHRLSLSLPDEVEPDGQPNAAGVPIGSYQSNIVYHLALVDYLQGDWNAACSVWELGRELNSKNDDRLCSSTYWHQLALRRAGRENEAQGLLGDLNEPLTILENESYRQLCLLFRGERTPEQVLGDFQPGTTEFATRGYGVACWQKLRGHEREARELLSRIVGHGPRNAFGCIAAEVDLKR